MINNKKNLAHVAGFFCFQSAVAASLCVRKSTIAAKRNVQAKGNLRQEGFCGKEKIGLRILI
ncbi:MAG: hypothetical protein ACPGWM_04965 [Flavobacteriales bacterium]